MITQISHALRIVEPSVTDRIEGISVAAASSGNRLGPVPPTGQHRLEFSPSVEPRPPHTTKPVLRSIPHPDSPIFSVGRRLQGSPSLRRMPGTKHLRNRQMPLRKLLGRLKGQVSKERAREAYYSHWNHPVSRLEHSSRLPLHRSWTTSRMLRLWKEGLRGSKLCSSTEGKIPSHLINSKLGIGCYDNTIYLQNTQSSSRLYKTASTLEYVGFIEPLPHPMVLRWTHLPTSTKKLLTESYIPDATSGCFPGTRWKDSLVPFSRRRYPWFRNQAKLPGFEPFTIFHTPIYPQVSFFRSTTPSILMCTLAPGVPSGRFALPSTTFPQDLRPPLETSQRPIAPYPSFPNNGPVSSPSYEVKTNIALILMTISVLLRLEGFMGKLLMLALTFFVLKGLVLCLNGLMTTSSSGYRVSTSILTMPREADGARSLPKMVGSHSLEVVYGTMEKPCQTICLLNLMKTRLASSKTATLIQFVLTWTLIFLIATLTLISFQSNWGYLGNPQKPFRSPTLFPFWVFAGTYQTRLSKLQKKRKINTKMPSRIGFHVPLTPWTTSKSFTENYYMPASWQRHDVPNSPTLGPCWEPSLKVLSLHATHPETPMTTSCGGSAPSAPKNFLAESLVRVTSKTMARSLMPAPELESQLSSPTVGGPGDSSRVGTQKEGTLGGPKQLASSSSSLLSSHLVSLANTLGSSATIEASSRVGGKEGAIIDRRTASSGESTISSLLTNALLSHATLPARRTQQMPLPGESPVA